MTEFQIQSKNFLPETIREYDLFSKLTEVLDYVLDTYHTKNIDILKAMYDIRNSNFDEERILSLLGSSEFIQYEANSEQLKVLCVLLSNLYEIKGTQKGLRYLLRLLDMDCKVYEWYDINKWYQQGDPAWTQEVPPCSIVIELNPGANSIGVCDRYDKWALPRLGTPEESVLGPNQAFEDTEGKFADFASRLLWICVTLNEIRWIKSFTDYVDIHDELKWVSTEVFYNKYSPYVTNCPYTLQVGHPVFQIYPYVGDPVLVGQATYQTSPFVVRSIQEYNNPIDYDGWENVGVVGYSHQTLSSNPPLVGETNLTVGQPSYWAWDGVEWVLGNYLIYQHILVGQRWVEGDISEGTHRVSGCTTSILHAHKEIEHEDSYTLHKGIYVGFEHTVQEPTNPGDSYLVDTQPGDVLTEETRNDISEQVVEIDTLHEHKETDFVSDIRDLYEPFLVGDPIKFVGDTNLRVGFDYFFTHFETQKEIGFQEQFSTSCLQVGEWGHAFFLETPYPLLVGQSGVNAGSSYFVGINTYPAHYENRNPLLFVGSALYVGSANFVGSTILVGQGFNYVGELSPWNATDFVKDSKNVIYENLHTIFNPIVEDSVDSLDSLESSKIEHGLKSDIHDSIWTQVVGSVSPVGLGVDYIGTPGEQVGTLGFVVGAADIHVAEDQYCKLEIAKEIEISEQVLIEAPVVAGSISDIGYSYEHPLLVGLFNVGDPHHIGETESFVDSKIFVGQDSFGRISTGKEINIRGVFSPNLQNTFAEEIDALDSLGDFDTENSLEDKVFAHRNIVGEGRIQNLDIVSEGDILVSPDETSKLETAKEIEISEQILIEAPVVGGYSYENPLLVGLFNVGQDPFGKISTGKEINIRGVFSYDITEELEFYFQEQFNINEDPIPEILGGEEDDVLLHQIPEEPDPNYLAGEELVPYEWDYLFNPTNSIHSLLSYRIEEDTHFSEQFALNLTMSQEVLGGEEEDVILHEIPGETNPVYLTGEELVPYVWDPLFNPENAINAALTYHIEEDSAVPGVSWTQINPSGGMLDIQAVDSLGSRVWFGTGINQRKLFYTDDLITFNESSLSHAAGLGFTGVCAVTPSLIVAVDGYNFWISTDSGVSFTRSTTLTGGRRFIRKVSDSIVVVTGTRIHVINPTNGSVIRSLTSPGGNITSIHMLDENTFVCGGFNGTYAAIFKTENQFSSITKVHEDTSGNTTGKGAIIQSDGTTLYAKMTVGTNTLVKSSADGGNTWNTISSTAIDSPGWFYVHNANSSVLSNQLAVQYLSTDQHQTYFAKQTLTGNVTNIFHLLPNGNLLAGTAGLTNAALWLSVPETPT